MTKILPLLFVGTLLPASSATLIYWDGTKESGSDQLVDKGTLGINAIRSSGGSTGTWAVVADGGPGGMGDAYLNLASNGSSRERNTFSLPTSTFDLKNQSWAVSGWFRRNTTATGTDMVFHFGAGDGFGVDEEFYLYGTGSAAVALQNYNPQDVNISGAGLGDNVWQSYVVNFIASGLDDGKGTIAYYLNGSLVDTDTTVTLGFSQSTLIYGGISTGGNNDRNFDGGVDDFALYDTPLTTDQITALHNRTATPLTVPEPSAALLGLIGALVLLRKKR